VSVIEQPVTKAVDITRQNTIDWLAKVDKMLEDKPIKDAA
jgi:hypothetical protein